MSFLYQEHFGLSRPPFQITPDIDYFFSGSRRGDFLTALLHVAAHEEGITTVVAEVGSGKTLLARLMISRLPDTVSTIYLSNPCFTRDEIISAIGRDLGLGKLYGSVEEKLASLHEELLRRHAAGQRVLLVIDEAHAMPVESLEEVRLLSNLETGQHKLVNIMLFGQPELDVLLADRRLRQLLDRVIHRFELLPFSREDGATYIDHRLRVAGWQGGRLFTTAAMSLLLKASGGRARRINLLADKSLLSAYADSVRVIDKRHVKSACEELRANPVNPATPPRLALPWPQIALISTILALIMAGGALWFLDGHRSAQPFHAAITDAAPARQMEADARSPATTATPAAPQPAIQEPITPEPVAPKPAQATDATGTATHAAASVERTAQLLRDGKLHGYTLQLATLPPGSNLTDSFNFVARHIDSSEIYLHNQPQGTKLQTVLYIGQHETERDAKAALENLPKPLKVNQPLIRTWARIRQESQQ